jgi:hypothetical protein
MSRNECVRAEIQTFLQAIASYADRVAHDPGITFEEHHGSLMGPARTPASDSAQMPVTRH